MKFIENELNKQFENRLNLNNDIFKNNDNIDMVPFKIMSEDDPDQLNIKSDIVFGKTFYNTIADNIPNYTSSISGLSEEDKQAMIDCYTIVFRNRILFLLNSLMKDTNDLVSFYVSRYYQENDKDISEQRYGIYFNFINLYNFDNEDITGLITKPSFYANEDMNRYYTASKILLERQLNWNNHEFVTGKLFTIVPSLLDYFSSRFIQIALQLHKEYVIYESNIIRPALS